MTRSDEKVERNLGRSGKCLDPKLVHRAPAQSERRASPSQRIVVADEQPVCRYALNRFFSDQPDLTCVAEAGTGQALLVALASKRPNSVIMGLHFPDADGIDLIKTIRSQHPALPILVLSAREERIYAERALQAGAAGFVKKREPFPELLNAVRCVLAGDLYLSRKMSVLLLHRTFRSEAHGGDSRVQALSDRELYVFQLLGAGLSSRKVATQLGVSLKTVESPTARISNASCR